VLLLAAEREMPEAPQSMELQLCAQRSLYFPKP
jgi:hypothetical protein